MGFPAMAYEAAPYICLVLQTAMLYRLDNAVSLVASFAAITSCLDFLAGLFNFLFMVVLANVGRAVGRRDWKAVVRRVRLALASAILLGLFMALVAAALQGPVSQLMRIHDRHHDEDNDDEDENDDGDDSLAPTGAQTMYFLRCAAMPAALILKVALGTLGGYQRLGLLTALNVGRAAVEVGATYAVLFSSSSSSAFVQEVGALGALGTVSLVCAYASAVAGVVLIVATVRGSKDSPSNALATTAAGHVTISSGDVDKNDKNDNVNNEDDDEDDEGGDDDGDEGMVGVWQFVRDSRDVMVRSACLQGSVWALAVSAASIGKPALAAHQILILLWMLTSYVVDGFADVGSMVGSQLLGGNQFTEFTVLTKRLAIIGSTVGVAAAVAFAVWRDDIITLFMGKSKHSHGDDGGGDDDDGSSSSDYQETAAILRECWTLFCVCQVTNSIVFTYDGLLIAAEQFAYTRNTFLVGTFGIFLPALLAADLRASSSSASAAASSLLAVWFAKALLNWWRAAASVGRISYWLPCKVWRSCSKEGGYDDDEAAHTTAGTAPEAHERGGARMGLHEKEVPSALVRAPGADGGCAVCIGSEDHLRRGTTDGVASPRPTMVTDGCSLQEPLLFTGKT
eukprot:CAMPEP_0171940572 /NCGR_PEP_ID=MMETSP0993-20121228/37177_1 /TAXON_ID=483369 /ORGANISM="non described non described, Strain CCMP2098" /LENGTH=623 /DNA_ID=CAMNT_0012582641 /DNA_START=18 /DNA_END=1889 /DNA_ORIENTATION=+